MTKIIRKTPLTVGLLACWLVADVINAGTMGSQDIPSWTGIYAGLNAGAIWGQAKFYTNNFGSEFGTEIAAQAIQSNYDHSLSGNGFIGGLQAGGNYQFNTWVIGLEGDFDYTGLDITRNTQFGSGTLFAGSQHVSADWLSTIRARLGMAKNNLLFFGTGGFALASTSYSDAVVVPESTFNWSSSKKSTSTGWTVGGGIEWMLSSALSLKAEYLYVDLGNLSYVASGANASTGVVLPNFDVTYNHQFTGNIFRVGGNYRFNI